MKAATSPVFSHHGPIRSERHQGTSLRRHAITHKSTYRSVYVWRLHERLTEALFSQFNSCVRGQCAQDERAIRRWGRSRRTFLLRIGRSCLRVRVYTVFGRGEASCCAAAGDLDSEVRWPCGRQGGLEEEGPVVRVQLGNAAWHPGCCLSVCFRTCRRETVRQCMHIHAERREDSEERNRAMETAVTLSARTCNQTFRGRTLAV